MNLFETPIEFETKKKFENNEVIFSDLMEITQGGPEIGKISINGKSVSTDFFGGPIIYLNGFIYAPVLTKKFIGTGFQLSKINIETLKVERIGKIRSLIFIYKIENNSIFFFENLEKTKIIQESI